MRLFLTRGSIESTYQFLEYVAVTTTFFAGSKLILIFDLNRGVDSQHPREFGEWKSIEEFLYFFPMHRIDKSSHYFVTFGDKATVVKSGKLIPLYVKSSKSS